MRYTIRNVPDAVDAALRHRAKEQNISLNQVVIEVLASSAGLGRGHRRRRDLSDIAGTWIDDPDFDRAVAEQDGRA